MTPPPRLVVEFFVTDAPSSVRVRARTSTPPPDSLAEFSLTVVPTSVVSPLVNTPAPPASAVFLLMVEPLTVMVPYAATPPPSPPEFTWIVQSARVVPESTPA